MIQGVDRPLLEKDGCCPASVLPELKARVLACIIVCLLTIAADVNGSHRSVYPLKSMDIFGGCVGSHQVDGVKLLATIPSTAEEYKQASRMVTSTRFPRGKACTNITFPSPGRHHLCLKCNMAARYAYILTNLVYTETTANHPWFAVLTGAAAAMSAGISIGTLEKNQSGMNLNDQDFRS